MSMEETTGSDAPETMIEMLTDWFETIEEVELKEDDRPLIAEAAESIEMLRDAAVEQGIAPEEFAEWLQDNVLDQFSDMIEDLEAFQEGDPSANPVRSFHGFIKGGEQSLYFQMMKWCITQSEVHSA